MKELQGSRDPTDKSRDQTRTPRRHSTRLPTTAIKSSKRNRSPEPTASSSRKRTSLSRNQSTLTQIDFVTQTTAQDDEQLDYIDEDKRRENAHTEPLKRSDGSDKDSDYLPAPPVRSTRVTKFKMNDQERNSSDRLLNRRNSGFGDRDADSGYKPQKNETPKATVRTNKGGRKSSEKSTGKRNKTLTQMDFVRRYITIDDDDDDVNMGYIQPTPHKKGIKNEQQRLMAELNEMQLARHVTPAKQSQRVFEEELDLSTGDPISQPIAAQERELENENEDWRESAGLVTPQKSRMREIPSSQTPESPGLAIITSSQFRSATRSPSKKKVLNPTNHCIPLIKEESPDIRRVVEDPQGPGNESSTRGTTLDSQSMHNSLNMSLPNNAEDFPSSAPRLESNPQELLTGENETPRNKLNKRERTVVYETDADSDYDDSENSLNRDSVTPSPKKITQAARPRVISQATQEGPESPKDDSQELPLPAHQSSPDLDDAPPPEPPMSDASVCYQRMHAATQFPHEPIPSLNTQKMAELFPHEGSTQMSNLGPGPLNPSRNQVPGPFSQTQTQSQGDKDPTEMVPESSPTRVLEQEGAGHATFQRPRVPKSVVQVESSQAVDRDPHWQAQALSRSQLLTSSVMESIPMPDFWMGSQDSVGEPYSLPEG
jgi:hypothetical protein